MKIWDKFFCSGACVKAGNEGISDHLARWVWDVVAQLDLSAFYANIEVAKDCVGRPATDPLILVALWVYALLQGVMEARVLARLCVEHLAYLVVWGGIDELSYVERLSGEA